MAKLILYEYFCNRCDVVFEKLGYSDYVYQQHSCGNMSKRCPSFRGTIHVFRPHYSLPLGKFIDNAPQYRDEMKKADLIQVHPGDTFNHSKAKAERKQLVEKATRQSVQKYLQSGISDLLIDGKPIPRIKETIETERIKADRGQL